MVVAASSMAQLPLPRDPSTQETQAGRGSSPVGVMSQARSLRHLLEDGLLVSDRLGTRPGQSAPGSVVSSPRDSALFLWQATAWSFATGPRVFARTASPAP